MHPACPSTSHETFMQKVAAVDCVDIGVGGRAEQNAVAWRGAAIRVGSRVGRFVVRAQVGLHLDNSPCQNARWSAMRKNLPEQSWSHPIGRQLEKRARHGAAWHAVFHLGSAFQLIRYSACWGPARGGTFAAYLWVFFHSSISASTSSAWPCGVTLGKMCNRVRSGPMTKVVRSMPMTFLPYMFFSLSTPN